MKDDARFPTPSLAAGSSEGTLRWSARRSLWLLAMHAGAAASAIPTFSPAISASSAALTAVLLCLGFSVGFHRLTIHRSFRTHLWLERLLQYLAMLNGIGGLLQLARKHELRDHWQNQPRAPEYYRYGHGPWRDYLWYLHLDHVGPRPLELPLVSRLECDRFLLHLDRHWMSHQALLGVLLFLLGGWPAVVWGIFVRVSVATTGIWFVNYVVHKHGYRNFELRGCSEEGRNSVWLGVLSMGEGWHNNHHAFPGSASMGVRWWEIDPGYLCIRLLRRLGLAWEVKTLGALSLSEGVRPVCPWCGGGSPRPGVVPHLPAR